MNSTVLIFPGGMPRAQDYLQKCLREKRNVVGASSLGYDAARDQYPLWTHLPYVTDPGFNEALKEVVKNFGVSEIYTANLVVWNHLSGILGTLLPDVALANTSPVDEVLSGYRSALSKASTILNSPLPLASSVLPSDMISEIETASLVRYSDMIPGMCDDDKFRALIEIARCSVQGDIVEIGSWWGKSAFILSSLSRSFELGNVLCVDPWSNEHLIQNEEIVDSGSLQVDAEEALIVFQIGLQAFNCNHINYQRMTSVEASECYGKGLSVYTEAFGETEYAGRISILHIDGNHAYEAVKADVLAWSKFVSQDGWVIIDDYIWPYGDGPQRIGDHFLEEHQSRIAASFVMGSALFIQLHSSCRECF
ncbi:Methyltransferase domain-containing protein [Mariprofundus aestuarium]|uniref:Methyltransferase domain-containing protein n=1 Tax=Mariprofundus aestuarium TaxID=1921086 RepID=A0A2K8KZB5_MARES|nr:class I SAM-dependent methyltransferase [Mariprofundus aestuarium]ATX80283.1 Methyltransferase domain-containing protein [Mariprofundus aestuarium]